MEKESNTISGSNSAAALRVYVERIERLESERNELAGDIREVLKEAKEAGFEPKILRKVIAVRRRSHDEVEKENHAIETYLSLLGVW